MRIALLTIWHEGNYGAEMQAYATIRALKELGHDVEMIDIRLSDMRKCNWKGRLHKTLSNAICPVFHKFNHFWSHYIPTTQRYKTTEELKASPPKADVYLVGSDQVWNPEITEAFSSLYFLNFGRREVKRISYASSFGKTTWDEDTNLTLQIKALLNGFSSLSCREKTGCGILRNEFGKGSVCVLDPTLLHKGYPELTGSVKERNTLVYYPVCPFPELESFGKELASACSLQYVNTNTVKKVPILGLWDRPSIEQWVENIACASFVVTQSFHGLAFSLIYHRQFAVVCNPGGESRSTRLTDLLKQLGLEERFFATVADLRRSHIWEKKIDYCKVESKLDGLREDSINYLKSALSK